MAAGCCSCRQARLCVGSGESNRPEGNARPGCGGSATLEHPRPLLRITARAPAKPIRPPCTVMEGRCRQEPSPRKPRDSPKATQSLCSRTSKSAAYTWLPSSALPRAPPTPRPQDRPTPVLLSPMASILHTWLSTSHSPALTHVITLPGKCDPAFSTHQLCALPPLRSSLSKRLIVWGLPLHVTAPACPRTTPPSGSLQPGLLEQTQHRVPEDILQPSWGASPPRGRLTPLPSHWSGAILGHRHFTVLDPMSPPAFSPFPPVSKTLGC